MIPRATIERALIYHASHALSDTAYAITAVDKPNKKITIAGDRRTEFRAGQLIKLTGSNLGRYTVAATALSGSDTVITVSEALPSATVDGNLIKPFTVTLEMQAAPRPPKPYLTLQVAAIADGGDDYIGDTDDDGLTELRGDRLIRTRWNAYGITAHDIIGALCNAFQKESFCDWLQSLDSISVGVVSEPTDLTELLENKWEPRCFVEATFYIGDNYTDDTGVIEEVGVGYTIEGGETTIEGTVTSQTE